MGDLLKGYNTQTGQWELYSAGGLLDEQSSKYISAIDVINSLATLQGLVEGAVTPEEMDARFQELIGAAPEALDTLEELAKALENDPDFAGTMTEEIGKKVNKEEGKGLSANDFTDDLLIKLQGIQSGANKIDKMSQLENDKGYITKEDIPDVDLPVKSVNGKIGNVVLTADDIDIVLGEGLIDSVTNVISGLIGTIKKIQDDIGDVSKLETKSKTVVEAINEVNVVHVGEEPPVDTGMIWVQRG